MPLTQQILGILGLCRMRRRRPVTIVAVPPAPDEEFLFEDGQAYLFEDGEPKLFNA